MGKSAKIKKDICIFIIVLFAMFLLMSLLGAISTFIANSSCTLNIGGQTVKIKVEQPVLPTDNTKEKLAKKLKLSGAEDLCNSVRYGLIGVKDKIINFSYKIANTSFFFDVSGYTIKPAPLAYSSGGSYDIGNVSQLVAFQKDINDGVTHSGAFFNLTNDINGGGNTFCIGNKTHPFSGNFWGDSHTIKNIKIKNSGVGSGSGMGFFGNIKSDGKIISITSVSFENISLTTTYSSSNMPSGIGILAGYLGCEACTNNAASTSHSNCYRDINISMCKIKNCNIDVNFNDMSPYGLGIGSLVGACSSMSFISNIEAVNVNLSARWAMGYISQGYYNTGLGGIVGAQLGVTTDASNNVHIRFRSNPIKLIISNTLFTGSLEWDNGSYQPLECCMGVGGVLGAAWCAYSAAYQAVEIKNTFSNFRASGIAIQSGQYRKAILFDNVCFGSFEIGATQSLSEYNSSIKGNNMTLSNNIAEVENQIFET